MNCPVIRRRLLGQERPDRPAPEAQAHLADCPACRAWHRRLLILERNLAHLPVPPAADARERTLAAILATPRSVPTAVCRRATTSSSPDIDKGPLRPQAWQPSPRELARQKLALAFALAATLLVFAVGFWAWPRQEETPLPPSAYSQLERQRDRLLLEGRTPRERVQNLAGMAKRLWAEAETMARGPDNERLAVLAQFYGELVQKDLLAQARALPAEERDAVLRGIREQLTRAESNAERAVIEPQTRPNATEHLKTIARASRAGNDRLGELLRGARG